MLQRNRLTLRKTEHVFNTRSVGNVPGNLLWRASQNQAFDPLPKGVRVEVEFLEQIECTALSQRDQAQQQMLCSHKLMVQAHRFLTRERQNMVSTGRKVVEIKPHSNLDRSKYDQ